MLNLNNFCHITVKTIAIYNSISILLDLDKEVKFLLPLTWETPSSSDYSPDWLIDWLIDWLWFNVSTNSIGYTGDWFLRVFTDYSPDLTLRSKQLHSSSSQQFWLQHKCFQQNISVNCNFVNFSKNEESCTPPWVPVPQSCKIPKEKTLPGIVTPFADFVMFHNLCCKFQIF